MNSPSGVQASGTVFKLLAMAESLIGIVKETIEMLIR